MHDKNQLSGEVSEKIQSSSVSYALNDLKKELLLMNSIGIFKGRKTHKIMLS
jgi:hypothetical protein